MVDLLDLGDVVVRLGKSALQFVGFVLTLAGLLLVTSPDRYAEGINQVAQKLINTPLANDQISLMGLAVLTAGVYTIIRMR